MRVFISILLLYPFHSILAQEFNSINSNNVLNYFTTNSKIIQLGNNNITNVLYNDSYINVWQEGNNNLLNFDVRNNQIQNHIIQVNALGNNNIIEIIGSNSISNGMKLDVIGNNKVVIINNR